MKKNKTFSTEQNDLEDSQSNDDYGFFSNLDNTIGRPQDDGVSDDTNSRLAAGSDAIDPDVPADLIVIDDPVDGWLDSYSYETWESTDSNGNIVYSYRTSWTANGEEFTSSGSDTYSAEGAFVKSEWSDSNGSHGTTTVVTDANGNTVYSYNSTYVDGDSVQTSSSTDTYAADGSLISSEWSDSSGSHGSTTVTTDANGNVIYSYDTTWMDGDNVLTTTSTDIYAEDGSLVSSSWSDNAGNSGSTTVALDADGNTVNTSTATWVDGGAALTYTSIDVYSPDGWWLSSSWSDSNGNQGSMSASDKDGGVIYWLDDIALDDGRAEPLVDAGNTDSGSDVVLIGYHASLADMVAF